MPGFYHRISNIHIMDRIASGFLIIALLLASGCVTDQTGPASPAGPTGAVPVGTGPVEGGLPLSQGVVMANGCVSVTASIDHFETGSPGADSRIIDIYIRAKNTGTKPVSLTWYSTLTDERGISHGGIGISHDGSGAQTTLLLPGYSEIARDYVIIATGEDYALLKNGAILDVQFFGKNGAGMPVASFHSAWTVGPGRI